MLLYPVLGNAAASVPPGQSMTNDAGAIILMETPRNTMRKKHTDFPENAAVIRINSLNQHLSKRPQVSSHTIIMKAPNDFELISHR